MHHSSDVYKVHHIHYLCKMHHSHDVYKIHHSNNKAFISIQRALKFKHNCIHVLRNITKGDTRVDLHLNTKARKQMLYLFFLENSES